MYSATLVVGGGLGVGPNGLSVLKRLDENLFRNVVCGRYPYSHFKMKNSYGWNLMCLDATGGSSNSPMNSVAMSRNSIWRCLRQPILEGIIVDKRVSQVVTNEEGRNIVRFTDGSDPVVADLVIGADGLKSTVKRAVFPEANDDPYPPRYEGFVGVGGFITPSDLIKANITPGSMTLVFGGNGFFGYLFTDTSASDPNRDSPYHLSASGDTVTWWSTYSIPECPDPKTINKEDVSQQLRKRHGNWRDPVVKEIVRSVRVATMYPAWTTPELPTWERDGLSCSALEDVESFTLFLSHYLRKAYHNPLPSQAATERQAIKIAAKRHMDLRHPHVQAILHHAKQMQLSKGSLNIFQEFLMYFILWIVGLVSSGSPAKEVFNYNIAEEVERVLASET
ncbi:hypothetical protein V1517DRAFT_339673 [Lipomyces orientalis]|uniref:Uncharacterized protein n=1 Tax=Lipomyces orientalis TaxID=1233043 RepID=A0ACC3TKB4_9ASCO